MPSIKILKSHFLNKQNPKHPKLICPQNSDIRKVRQPAEKRWFFKHSHYEFNISHHVSDTSIPLKLIWELPWKSRSGIINCFKTALVCLVLVVLGVFGWLVFFLNLSSSKIIFLFTWTHASFLVTRDTTGISGQVRACGGCKVAGLMTFHNWLGDKDPCKIQRQNI